MSIIEHLREFMIGYPDLPAGAVGIDFLGAEPTQFTLEPVPCDPVYKRYADGDIVRQFLFVFASRAYYGDDLTKCAENQALFEGMADWIRACDDSRTLPALDDGQAVGLEVVSNGYAFSEDAKTARYQMQIRFIYEQQPDAARGFSQCG